MALTRDFKQTVLARVQADPAFREALLLEGVAALLAGELELGKAVLRDYIKATVGFEQLGIDTGTSPKSLMRMFGPRGNPQARNLFAVIQQLQRHGGLQLQLSTQPGPRSLAGRAPRKPQRASAASLT